MGVMGATGVMIIGYYQAVLPLKEQYIYSPSEKLFYHPATDPELLPKDYVTLSQEEADLMIQNNPKGA